MKLCEPREESNSGRTQWSCLESQWQVKWDREVSIGSGYIEGSGDLGSIEYGSQLGMG